MRRSTTSGATERLARPVLGLLLVVELLVGVALLGPTVDAPAPPPGASPATSATPAATSASLVLRDGRTAEFLVLGGDRRDELAGRITTELDAATAAVTAFWGDEWPRHVVFVLTGTDEEFRAIGGGGSDIAATTTAERIAFAP